MTRASSLSSLRRSLLRWFEAHRRDLPWRRGRTPYRVWLAEVMLQQTQVATATPYFERFVARFPDASSLAGAELTEVLSLWRGLGYYSRARNLHRAAQQIARDGMPTTAASLRELPGFGRYTAAAVASLAFGEAAALVDGNVARVLSRLRGLADPPGSPGREERLWGEAEALLDPTQPGAFNEALMELGALVCTPSQPRCGQACPWTRWCEARRQGRQASIPPPKPRAAPKKLALACAVVRSGGDRILLARRPEHGLFGGLWELPCVPVARPSSALRELEHAGLHPRSATSVATVRRQLTHRALSLHLFVCDPPKARLEGYLEQRMVARSELASLGIASAMSGAIEKALAAEPPKREGGSRRPRKNGVPPAADVRDWAKS
ncbi:MAG TPA: A/G-specific adenine glycosylase [Myxococcales bacterium]